MSDVASTLNGVMVVDLTSVVAGPFATQILATLGATVIKVERPPLGDDSRQLPPLIDGVGAVFRSYNRRKSSVVLDLKSAPDREAMWAMLKTADVLVESWRPGKLSNLGFGFDDVHEVNPALIYCSISAFGSGPLGRDLPGYDPVIQALSGIMYANGQPGEAPSRVPVSIIDMTTGMWAAISILGGLQRRRVGLHHGHERDGRRDAPHDQGRIEVALPRRVAQHVPGRAQRTLRQHSLGQDDRQQPVHVP